jgi:hypothetical protein
MNIEMLQPVVLNWPTVLQLQADAGGPPRSWIQLARTGSFVSKRYGKFSITKDDLSQMLTNFNEITPKAPTELPIDYDHLSMDPKMPGDGAAAAWIKKLELRENGDELWGEVEWTPDGADRVRKQEYRFISPSFVKNYVHKDGQKIGTTLLAAAITNHPFLEGMRSLTLASPAIQAISLTTSLRDCVATPASAVLLAAIGQRVTVNPQHVREPAHLGATFEVVRVDDAPGDERVWLKSLATGDAIGWYRPDTLEPAPPAKKEPQMPTTTTPEQRLLARAQELAADGRMDLSSAVKQAAAENATAAAEYLEQYDAAPSGRAEESASPVIISLHRRPDEGFVELVGRVQQERRIDLRDAIRVVSQAYPSLAEDYASRG